jgi:hypothetical protein
MELMRHSDRRLTDRVYTDSSLLERDEAVRKLCGFGPAQLHSQGKDVGRPRLSSSGTNREPHNEPETRMNTGVSRNPALAGASCHRKRGFIFCEFGATFVEGRGRSSSAPLPKQFLRAAALG